MVKAGVNNGGYAPKNGTTLVDLKLFQSFLCRNFKNYEHYEKMRPVNNKPARLYGTAKSIHFNIHSI